MQSQNKKIKKLIFWIVLSSVIYITENLLPRPLPWLKIGLANIVFLLLLKNAAFKLKDLFVILIIRNVIASFFTGVFLSPVFFTGLIAGAGAIISMSFMFSIFKDKISFISVSIIGALVNMSLQISAGSLLVFNNFALVNLLIYFLFYAYLAGILTGIFANKIHNAI